MTKDVGYGKPPVKSQYKKGTSGNPHGRPKKKIGTVAHPHQLLMGLLNEEVSIKSGKKTKKITIGEATLRNSG